MANVLEVIIAAKDQASQAIHGVKGSLAKLGESLKVVGASMAVVGAAVAASVGLVLKQTVKFGVELDLLRKRTGVSADALSSLGYAAEQEAGIPIAGVAEALKFLGKRMADAQAGLSTAKRAFSDLGVETVDSEGKFKSLNEMFLESADAFRNLESDAKKSGVAMDLFGGAGAALIPLLNVGREGIEAYTEQAKALGIVMTDEAAAKTKRFDDAVTTLKAAVKGMTMTVGMELIPQVTKLAETFAEAAPEIVESLKPVVRIIGRIARGWIRIIGLAGRKYELFPKAQLEAGDEMLSKLENEIDFLRVRIDLAKESGEAAASIAILEAKLEGKKRELAEETAKIQIKSDKEVDDVKKGLLSEDEERSLKKHEGEVERIEAMREQLIEFHQWQAEQRGEDARDIIENIERKLEAETEGTERHKALIEALHFFQQERQQEAVEFLKGRIGDMTSAFGAGIEKMMKGEMNLRDTAKFVAEEIRASSIKAIAATIAEETRKFIISKMFARREAMAKSQAAYAGIPFVGIALGTAAAMAVAAIIEAFQFGGTVFKPTFAKLGEAGPERVTPMAGAEALTAGAAVGGGPVFHFHISGTFVEGDETKWENLTREHIVPQLETYLARTGKVFA